MKDEKLKPFGPLPQRVLTEEEKREMGMPPYGNNDPMKMSDGFVDPDLGRPAWLRRLLRLIRLFGGDPRRW